MNASLALLRGLICAGVVTLAAGTATAQDPVPAPTRPIQARIGINVVESSHGGVAVRNGTRPVIVEEWRDGHYREREEYLMRSDTIDAIDGVSIRDSVHLLRVLDAYRPGDWIRISGFDASTGHRERYTARLRLR